MGVVAESFAPSPKGKKLGGRGKREGGKEGEREKERG